MKIILLDNRLFDEADRQKIDMKMPPDIITLLIKFHLNDGEMVRVIKL